MSERDGRTAPIRGRSVYRTCRAATRLELDVAAQLLGADRAQVEAQIRAAAKPTDAVRASTGRGCAWTMLRPFLAPTGDCCAEIAGRPDWIG